MANQPRILVIDDDPSCRQLLLGLLNKSYEVITAASGEAGYQLAMDHPPHAALIDIQMPGWDGLETLRRFREHPDLLRTKTMVLTGDASRAIVVSAIRAGADEYLVKTNFGKDELLKKLKALIARSPLWVEEQAQALRTSTAVAIEGAGWANGKSEEESRLQELIDGWE
jgi:DNA-binding response OmpR family regulator